MEFSTSVSEKLDILTPEQIAALNSAKVTIRLDNEQYLREHPDVSKVMRALVRGVLKDRPSNVGSYAYQFFTRTPDVVRKDLDSKE